MGSIGRALPRAASAPPFVGSNAIARDAIFWKLHVLPEKIAAARHHPQRDAIHVLCLLSLAFGGLLWPLAWLWAYARPTTTFMASAASAEAAAGAG